MCSILKSCCFLLEIILTIMYFFNFTLDFYVKDLTTKVVLFSDQSKMASMFCPSLPPLQSLKFIGLIVVLPLLISGIIDWVILLLVF